MTVAETLPNRLLTIRDMTKKGQSEKKYTLGELQGQPPKTAMVVLSTVGLLIIAVGALLPIFAVKLGPQAVEWWKYVYAAGALCFLTGKIFTPYTGSHPRVKRLYRIESWSAVFFCVAAFFLFWSDSGTRDVWAFTLAGGVLLIFTTIAIPRTIKKALKD